jgi:hypothetical protein
VIIWLFGEEAGPYMQSLHFFFGLGAFLSPLIVGEAMKYSATESPQWAFWGIGLLFIPMATWLLTFSVSRREQKHGDGKSTIGKVELVRE